MVPRILGDYFATYLGRFTVQTRSCRNRDVSLGLQDKSKENFELPKKLVIIFYKVTKKAPTKAGASRF